VGRACHSVDAVTELLKRPHKKNSLPALPVLIMKPNARENLIRHFSALTVRENLRFWIDMEVRWLIISAKIYLLRAGQYLGL
jgi:hypothetical protein